MSFADTVKSIQAEFFPPESNQHIHPEAFFLSLETLYLKEIKKLIIQLNGAQGAKSSQILAQIHETDRLYLDARGMEITAQVLFSRHGECGMLGQKKLGLSPNAAISEEAEKNMAITNQLSGALLCYSSQEHPPLIAVSPMNRAMQTASLVIPQEINNADIKVLPFLTENSVSPSGFDVRSIADMQELYDQLSFWTSPFKKLLLKLSIWTHSDEDFSPLYEKRKSAAEKIEQHGKNKILSDGDKPDVCQNLKYHGDKILETKTLINTVTQRDCWLFGHGRNFRAFFQDVFGMDTDFDYGETRRVYKTKINDKISLYNPPYALVINQKTGKIEGKYTGGATMPLQKKSVDPDYASSSEGKTIPNAPKAMAQLGSPVIAESGTLEKQAPKNSAGVEERADPENEIQVYERSPLINTSN
ncbi:histidine phosphatase family protein [Legionella sp. PATHC035]|uniref:histidine phosphatase family protein n=1 Tax=Legionella sp. PATHC035 TaxID=2992040 RepID=UPI0022437EAC|nr:histidine phosphatase family protein [Legionella sp. PATHC035]MCW8409917.1 histidine phosphatase family protein [Legionella sp. PATHC035]